MNRVIREEWIKLENDLAEELLNSCEAYMKKNTPKYMKVYMLRLQKKNEIKCVAAIYEVLLILVLH